MKPEEITNLIEAVENYSRDKIVEALRNLQNCWQKNKELWVVNSQLQNELKSKNEEIKQLRDIGDISRYHAKKKEVEQLRKILNDRDIEIGYLHGIKVQLENEVRALKQSKTSITIKVNEFSERTKQIEQQGNLLSKFKQQIEDLKFEKRAVLEANAKLGAQINSLQSELNNRHTIIRNLQAQVQLQHQQLYPSTPVTCAGDTLDSLAY